jgi:hypothetical protein
MIVRNNNIAFKSNTELDKLNKRVKEFDKQAKTAFNSKDNEKLNTLLKDLTNFKEGQLKTHKTNLTEHIKNNNLEKDVPKYLVEKLKWITKQPAFKNAVKNKSVIEYLLVMGNVGKEAVGTAVYTAQALTNEDLPPDKRKFIGMYDFCVGAISTTMSLVAGIFTIKYQEKLIKKILPDSGHNKYSEAFKGMVFLIPLVSQTILIKRIIAPAIATPFAGKMKKKMEAKEALKTGQKPTDYSIPIENNIVLSSTRIKGHSANIKNSATPSENIFDLYKHSIEEQEHHN